MRRIWIEGASRYLAAHSACECADTQPCTQLTEQLRGSVQGQTAQRGRRPVAGASLVYSGSWREAWAREQGEMAAVGGREAWRRIRRRVVRFVKGSLGCHGKEEGLRGQAGRRLQTSRQEVMEAETNAFREEGPQMPWGWAGRAEGAPPHRWSICPTHR